ncbi:uncharacterized protein Z518_08660 [Rhinocladiella mackenziei CBS 650.93]|uniref:Rhinocladiella mackenziei CBS 650.93 unplaced genomic scaffold supercont1.6, whole genome shotgun sequence n=1 Tax=Rhinocladiella mackenziei CBS 650.93 TaxID=1442369 RepID=A0A0D2GWW9_9EURO|nr:uncharacterized protein Z518_08660 [Rhinocladiella mackenziei CBS 650.93]KIX02718.1 hypothetical protein Z518_08660 [Rhinocladiella mackenziei CBS 650.93]
MNHALERELKQLEDDVIRFKIQEQVCERATAQYAITRNNLAADLKKIKDIALELATAERKYEEHDAEVKQLNERITYLKEWNREICRRERENAGQIEEWQQERDRKFTILRDLEAKLSRDDRECGDLRSKLQEPEEALQVAQMSGGAPVVIKALRAQVNEIVESLSRLERERRVNERSLESCRKEFENLETKIADAHTGQTKEKNDIRNELAKKREDVEEAGALLQESKTDRDDLRSKMDREVSRIMDADSEGYLKMLEDQRKAAAHQRQLKEERLIHKKEEFRISWRKVVDGDDKRRKKAADLFTALRKCNHAPAQQVDQRGYVQTTPKQRLKNLELKLDTIIGDFQQLMNEWPTS